MNSLSDVKQLIRERLVANTTVDGLVRGRVHTAHPRFTDPQTIEMPCLIVDVINGRGQYSGGSQGFVFDLYAYDRTSDGDADALYKAAYEALNMERLFNATTANGTRALSAAGYSYEVERPIVMYNSDVGAWFARGKWRGHTAG